MAKKTKKKVIAPELIKSVMRVNVNQLPVAFRDVIKLALISKYGNSVKKFEITVDNLNL